MTIEILIPGWRGRLAACLLACSLLSGCPDLEPAESHSPCCDCLVEHKCTPWDRVSCGQVANGTRGTLPVDGDCSEANNCSKMCADEGFVWSQKP